MTMMCMAALLLMAVSCKKEKANEEYTGEGFRATTESHTGEGDSKTQLLDDLSVTWCSGDEIKVFSGSDSRGKEFSAANAGTTADLNPGEGVTDAFFTPPYTAFYPYGSATGTNQISLEETQHYTVTDDGVLTFAVGENPMAAQSSNKELPFKNLCGILKFQLYSESSCTVKSLCVTSLKSGEQLWGTGTVTFDGTNATLGALTGGTGSITLDCSNKDVELGTVDAPTEFMFVIPDGALSKGFTVTVTDADDKVWSKTTTANNTITKSKIKAMPKQAVETKLDVPEGALPGRFSVSDTKRVYFSKGNLQYLAKGGSGGDASATADPGTNVGGTWRFAEHQFDFIGADNANAAQTYGGWIDLFCWGSTGNAPKDDDYYVNYQPWATSTSSVNISYNYYGYGPSTNSSNPNLLVSNGSDWGANAISNGGNQEWRTLIGGTSGNGGEWDYLLNTRKTVTEGLPNASSRYAKVKVNGVSGMLLFPDSFKWTSAMGAAPTVTNNSTEAYPTVSYTVDQFAEQEKSGIVFLPAAGSRFVATVSNEGSRGYYWSSLYQNNSRAYCLDFASGSVGPNNNGGRNLGFSVRLVMNAN